MSTSPCKHCKSVITKPHEKTERQISLEFIGLPFQNRCTDHCYLVRACKVALWNTFSHPPRQRALCETSALTDNLSGHMWHTARMKLVQMLAPLAFSIHDASWHDMTPHSLSRGHQLPFFLIFSMGTSCACFVSLDCDHLHISCTFHDNLSEIKVEGRAVSSSLYFTHLSYRFWCKRPLLPLVEYTTITLLAAAVQWNMPPCSGWIIWWWVLPCSN